jgi:DNA (cytosine-5)-methyltransferase 1
VYISTTSIRNKRAARTSAKAASKARANLPAIVSLFSGVGGLDHGFTKAGFKTLFALDIDAKAVASFNENSETKAAVQGDLVELGVRGILKLIRERIPVGSRIGVIGGPPCQGFSQANTLARSRDIRNRLPSLYVKVVRALCRHYQVEFILFENVSGILSKKYQYRYAEIKRSIRKLKFELFEKTLNAADFGVPQNRLRVFLVGMPKSAQTEKFVFPVGRSKVRSVRDAIANLPEPTFFRRDLNSDDIAHHPNHWTMNPKSKNFGPRGVDNTTWRCFKRLQWDAPSRTIAFGHREIFVHPEGARRLSVFEALLLQGFPKRFRLIGNLSNQVTQVSNAVPPPLAFAVARSIRSALNGSHARKD